MIRARVFLSLNLITLTLLLFHPNATRAQNATPHITSKPAGYDSLVITDDDIQVMRKDIRSQRKQVIAANMRLTDVEAEKFWPVYEQYVSELTKISDPKFTLLKQYVQVGGALTDTEAENALQQWIDSDQAVVQLRMKYLPNFRKVLSAKSTALFFQLDRRIQLMIDTQLAAALPLVEP